jgi:hypothetical protein
MTDLVELSRRVRAARARIDQQVGEAKSVALAGKTVQEQIASLTVSAANLAQAGGVLSLIGEQRQESAQKAVETVVTSGLQSIFGPELSFVLVPGMRGKTPIVEFVVRTTLDGKIVETDVMDSRGGGLAAVVGFLLRVAVLLLGKKPDPVIFLDETFGMLSTEYVPAMADFLRELVDRTGIQVVLITHQDQFAEVADRKYRLELDSEGWTKVS